MCSFAGVAPKSMQLSYWPLPQTASDVNAIHIEDDVLEHQPEQLESPFPVLGRWIFQGWVNHPK